jgi:hypothetical protein
MLLPQYPVHQSNHILLNIVVVVVAVGTIGPCQLLAWMAVPTVAVVCHRQWMLHPPTTPEGHPPTESVLFGKHPWIGRCPKSSWDVVILLSKITVTIDPA